MRANFTQADLEKLKTDSAGAFDKISVREPTEYIIFMYVIQLNLEEPWGFRGIWLKDKNFVAFIGRDCSSRLKSKKELKGRLEINNSRCERLDVCRALKKPWAVVTRSVGMLSLLVVVLIYQSIALDKLAVHLTLNDSQTVTT